MIRVEYGVINNDAKEGFVPELLNCAEISNAENLTQDDVEYKNYSNPCENYAVLLDGSHLPIPEDTTSENMGVWSKYTSDEFGVFNNDIPTVRFVSDEVFSTDGLTLYFDTQNNVYPTDISVSWYRGNELILAKDFYPDSPVLPIYEEIGNFDIIDISFRKMNTPYSRLRLNAIQYGTLLFIEEKNIKNMKVHQAVSPISTTIPISTFNMSFLNVSGADYNFSARQSLKVFNNDTLMGQFFIENANKTTKQQWNIRAQDYIATLESTEFVGGIYVNETANNLLTDIFNAANVPFSLAEELQQIVVSGYIPYTTCRAAVQQVLFAIGAYCKTAYSTKVDILEINADIADQIPFDRILQGQSIAVDADITEIELIGHNYTESETEITLHQSKEADEEVKIIFNEPIHHLTIENGEILQQGVNYAIISCNAGGVLMGKKYDHSTFSKSKINAASANKKTSNKKTIRNATLISSQNIDKILNICYNYIARNTTVKSKVIEAETPLMVGNAYEIETERLGYISGILSEQSFSLYGSKKVVKETVIK